MKTSIKLLSLFVLLCISTSMGYSKNRQPNILFVLIDDLGWKDLGCYGGTFAETPTVDRLAHEGMRFTQAYASPVCSPTRASLISGQNSARHGIWEVIGVADRPYAKMKSPPMAEEIPEKIDTYADILKREGYKCGIIGKWHAGRTPQAEGFCEIEDKISDRTLAEYAKKNSAKGVGKVTAQSIEFLRENKDKPFLLCVSHHAVHAPLDARKDLIVQNKIELRYNGITNIHPTYAAMVEMVDESLDMLLNELETLGLSENTIVVFYSDNGGLVSDIIGDTPLATTILPLRSQKGTLYEGGIRVPLIVRWPGKVDAGSICDEAVMSYDLFSTFVEIGGGKIPSKQVSDGISLVPLLTGESQTLDRNAIYWHFPTSMWTRSPMGAIRKGNFKLLEDYTDGSIELYDLSNDIGETINLVGAKPDIAQDLLNDLRQWRESVGAQMPIPNPDYDPVRSHKMGHQAWW